MVIVLKRKVKSVLGYFTSQRVVDIVITSAAAAAAIVDAHEHEHGAPHVHVCQGDLQLRLRGLLQRDANQAYNHMHSKKGLKIDQAHTHSQTKTKIMHHRTAHYSKSNIFVRASKKSSKHNIHQLNIL